MFSQVAHPPVDYKGVRIPRLDDPLMYPSLKVFLTFLVDKRPSEDGPHRTLCREWYRTRGGNTQRARRVSGKVRKEVERVVVV